MVSLVMRRMIFVCLLLVASACSPGDVYADFSGSCDELEITIWDDFPREDVNTAIPYLSSSIEKAVELADQARVAGATEEEDSCAHIVNQACDVRWELTRAVDYEGSVLEESCFYNTGRFLYVPPDAEVPDQSEEDLGLTFFDPTFNPTDTP